MFGPIGAAVGKKLASGVGKNAITTAAPSGIGKNAVKTTAAGGVGKNAVKKSAAGRVKSMFQGQEDGAAKPMEVTIKQPKTMFRGTDMTEFRGY